MLVLFFVDCKRHRFWLKHTRFLARNLGCSVSSGQKCWSQYLCQILFWWSFLFACQNYTFVTVYFSCSLKVVGWHFLENCLFDLLVFVSHLLLLLLIVKSILKHFFFLFSFNPFCVVSLQSILLPIFQS